MFIAGFRERRLNGMKEVRKKLKIFKFVKFRSSYFFSLVTPHWPSDAFDNMIANGGMNFDSAGSQKKRQTDTVIIGITRKCSHRCRHCYELFNLSDTDTVPLDTLKKVTAQIQEKGTSVIIFSGGEPMMRYDDLLELLVSGDHRKSDFHIHTSGYAVTPDRAKELKKAGLIAAGVGLDDFDPARNDKFRGWQGSYEQAVNAIKCFSDAGIFAYVNSCPTPDLLQPGGMERFLDLLKSLNVGIVRWLEPKPCGGYLGCDGSDLLSEPDKALLRETYIKFNTGSDFRDYPLISYEAFSESAENMGCMMAGNSQYYIDTAGNVQPCVFFPVAFGNITGEDFQNIYKRMRLAVPEPIHGLCPTLRLSTLIKSRKDNNDHYPVPFEEIKTEFQRL